jgi:NDP-sugar pyrophosphorylase family protein
LDEAKPLGTAGSLGLLPENLPESPILVMNSDLLTRVNFQELLRYHEDQRGVATICARDYELQVPYGVIETEGTKLVDIAEKPQHHFFVNAGIYVLNPSVVKKIKNVGAIDMTDVLISEVADNNNVVVFPVHEYWLDIGRVDEFERAQNEVKKRGEDSFF